MGFFDLNIPYIESPPSDAHKTTRVKIVIKAMELGYTGVAYNRTIKGVMSDRDRCSIPLLTLSALLKLAPSISSSVNFHRDLLGIPRSSPFRQYTRLTVYADTISQCQVLNSGNPVLKTYDLVAVRPLNQSAFDHACEKAVVDIISINFAEKLPFRLKLPIIKAAIERGVYFEITYSDLILDVQLRRQMISNAKLLVDWTRGKNLILSSGASSVNELRGPNDVANLSSLLGISMERAKAAVSKNCRTLISNALKKKYFHKETIRVEPISSGEQFYSKEHWSVDTLKWDPISSGEGDLQLDDMAKSFTASTKVSKIAKTFNFASVIDSIPSHGFQVKGLISGTQAVSQSQDGGKSIFSVEKIEKSVAPNGVAQNPTRVDVLNVTDQSLSDNAPLNNQSSGCENDQELDLPTVFPETIIYMEDVEPQPTINEKESKTLDGANKSFTPKETERDDQNSKNGISSHEVDLELSKEIVKCPALTTGTELGSACNAGAKSEGDKLSDTFDLPACQNEESKSSDADLGSQNVAMGEVGMEIDTKDQEDTSVVLDNVSLQENVIEDHFRELVNDVSDKNPLQGFCNEIDNKCDTSVANHETEVTMEEQRDGEPLKEPGDTRLIAEKISIPESCIEMLHKDDYLVLNHEASKEITVEEERNIEQFREPEERVIINQNLFLASSNEFRVKDDPSDADQGGLEDVKMDDSSHADQEGLENVKMDDSSDADQEGLENVKMEEQIHGEAESEIVHPTLVPCVSGKVRAKPRMPHPALLIPLKRMLNPLSFKRKARKFKHRITML